MLSISHALILLGSMAIASAAPTCSRKPRPKGGQYIHTNGTDVHEIGLWGGGGRGGGGGDGNHHWGQWGDHSRGSDSHQSPPPVHEHSTPPVVVTTSSRPVIQTTSERGPVPTTSDAPVPPQPSQSSTGGGGGGGGGGAGGAGVGVNPSSGLAVSSFTGLNWYFNWDVNPLPNMGSLEWVPNVHGRDHAARAKAASASWQGVKYVLGFNEPDIAKEHGGSDIDAVSAASLHKEWVTALGGNYLIGTPAVARGGKKWMNEWLAACGGGCRYDFVPFHFYGTDANELIEYAKDFHTTFGKPLWLTEFACKDYGTGATCPDTGATQQFMKTAIDWFNGEGKDIVHRWAWFGAFPEQSGQVNGIINTDGTANALGSFYGSQ